ncbi:MAG: FtsX-like permease family protein, partial [Opitutaceae bacterium]
AYSVSRRTREIGLRLALGAQIADVFRLVLRQGFGLVALGLVLGLGGAIAGTRVLRSQLFNVEPLDPLTFVAATGVFLLVAFLACYLPARRAAKVDPMIALRAE